MLAPDGVGAVGDVVNLSTSLLLFTLCLYSYVRATNLPRNLAVALAGKLLHRQLNGAVGGGRGMISRP